MDKTRLNTLLDSVYELEGLIHLALNRDDIPDTLERLIARKGMTVADATRFATEVPEDNLVVETTLEPETLEPETSPEILAPFGEALPPSADDEAPAGGEVEFKADGTAQSVAESDTVDINNQPEIVGIPPVADEIPVETPKTAESPRGRLVFTLNDRFRFKRELFGNSDEVFNKTLANVAMFDSYEEAENYFLSDLQWNADREEVKEFLD
ncbi:MAG: hypothetical protein K2H15_04785, partial [Muribaculaceae bacterium]|nr:hypothetical protein [Muribaculaceae bacterium]